LIVRDHHGAKFGQLLGCESLGEPSESGIERGDALREADPIGEEAPMTSCVSRL